MLMFDSRICGIPCQIKPTTYHREVAARTWGRSDDWHPGEPEEFEFEVYDRKGYRAKWLEAKLTDRDYDRILEEYKEDCRSYDEP